MSTTTITNPHLICFLGRNTSGKSYKANQLVKEQNYIKISMADSMRELAWKTLGWRPKDDKEYSEFKNCILCEGEVETDSDGDNTVTFTGNIDILGRQYLQSLGEGCKALFGQDFWVKQWERKVTENMINKGRVIGESKIEILETNGDGEITKFKIDERVKNYSFIVCDDIRFPIEIIAAHKLGAIFIWSDYQNGDYPIEGHASEALANKILANGKYQDGDEISFEDLKAFF